MILNNDVLGVIYTYLPAKCKIMTQKTHLVRKILSYLPIQDKMLLDRYHYHLIQYDIVIANKSRFYINIVKKNMSDLFMKYIRDENITNWYARKKYYFDNNVFSNFISLLEYIAIQYKCVECRKNICDLRCDDKYKNYNRNKHKNKICKNIIWS